MKTLVPWIAGLSLLAISLVWLVGPVNSADEPAAKDPFHGLVKTETEIALEAMNNIVNKKPTAKLDEKRAKAAALYIAVYAQERMAGKEDKMAATVRDAGLKLYDEINLGAWNAATETASAVKAGLKVDPKANPKPIPLVQLDIEVAMQHFKAVKKGGAGLETKIKDLKGKATTKELADIENFAAKTAILMKATTDLSPAGLKPADKRAWMQFAQDAETAANQASQMAKAGQLPPVKTALGKLDTACVSCHDKFK